MKAIQKIKQKLKSLSAGATSKVLFGHGVASAQDNYEASHSDGIASKALLGHGVASARRYGRGAPSTSVVTSGESSKCLARDSYNTYSANSNHVLRHGLFLSLYSLIKKASGKLPWRSRTNSLNTTRNYIKNFRRIRILGSASLFSLGLLLLATFVPLYNVTRTEDTEATAGTAQDSTITFTSTRSTASVDLTVTDENGTFASSTDGTNGTTDTRAAFSLSTTNFTGYTLTIASNTNTSALTNTNGSSLSSISSPIDESTFNTATYNNQWGYKPNYYGSAANSNYLPSPTTTADTLDETTSANSTAKNYTIALGARADYTNASGTYSSSNYKLMYVANPVAYSISFDKGSAAETPSNMPSVVTGSVSALSVNLPNTVPTRTAYDFTGWCLGTISTTNNVDSCTGTGAKTFAAGSSFGIDRESSNTGVTLHAMWKIKTYSCFIQAREQDTTGLYGSYDTKVNKTVNHGGSCSWSVAENATMKGASYTNNNVTSNISQSLNIDRKQYTLTVQNGGNTTVSGGGTKYAGQSVTLTATPTANTTCITYGTPTWTKNAGTLNTTSGTSVTFTMPSSAATVTATSSSTRKTYTISYNANGGTGTTSSTTGNCGANSTLAANGFSRTNYSFLGWSTSSTATTASYNAGTAYNLGERTSNLTLYAVWKDNRTYMQDMKNSDCTTTAKTVYDNRDGEAYLVQKLADGKCWMLDNLRLGGTSAISLTTANTNSNGNFTLPAGITSNFNSYTVAQINVASKDTVASTKYGSGSGKIGVYYNYCAASAGTYCMDSSSGSGNASYDICPKGWRMPTGDSSGEYQALYTAYSSNATNFRNALSTPLSGYFRNSSANYQGSDSYFWSSTRREGSDMYALRVVSSAVVPATGTGRSLGISVRCIKKPDNIGYMQNATASTLASAAPNVGNIVEMTDSRDGEKYLIGKLADGKYWMLDNLRLGVTDLTADITPSNTNTNTTIAKATWNGYRKTSGFNSYTSPMFNSASANSTTTSYGSGSGKIGVYYNYCAASAGGYCAAGGSGSGDNSKDRDICPKGWRMPTGGSSGEYQALYTAYSSNNTNFRNALSTPLSGYFLDNVPPGQDSEGYFWSSTYSNGSSMYYLVVYSTSVYTTYSYERFRGFSVRCILK